MNGDDPLRYLAPLLVAATLVGLLVRHRIGLDPPFAAYLGLSLLRTHLVTAWPEELVSLRSWMVQESALAMAGVSTAHRVRTWAIAGLGIGLLLVTVGLSSGQGFREYLLPSLETARTWAYVTALVVIYPYRSALTRFQRMILLGLGLNLVALGAAHLAFGELGLTGDRYVSAFHSAAVCATLALWVWAAWTTRDEVTGPA